MTEQLVTKDIPLIKEELALLRLYVEPHRKISREVTQKDVERVLEDAAEMERLCHVKRGLYPSAYAIHHSQINKKDPLSFFVTSEGGIVINPIMIRHTESVVEDLEACLSYPTDMPIKKKRFWKITCEYQTVAEGKLTNKLTAKLKSVQARFWQHEIDHGKGILIYDQK